MLESMLVLFGNLLDALVSFFNAMGYPGIFVLMAIESSIIPVPSELVLIPAGILIVQGKMSFFLVFLFSVAGSIMGSLICYTIAFYLGRKPVNALIAKYGSILLLDSSKLRKTDAFFDAHGPITIFTARMIPVIRHLISLPAGFAKMNPLKFFIYTLIGSGIWAIVLILLGMLFGTVAIFYKFFITIIALLAALIIILIYMIIQLRKKH